MITELKEAMASGLGEMSKRLMDLDGKASEGFADVRAALERSDEAVREGVNELHEALKASELKLAKQLDKASLTNLEVVKGVKSELTKLGGCLEALPLESIDSLFGAVDEMKKDLEKKAKDAKDDQEALRAVLSDAVSAVQVMSLKVDALQAQVSQLSLKFNSHSEEMVALIRSGDEATKQAAKQAHDSFEAVLSQALGEAAAVSDAAMRQVLLGHRGELMRVLGDLNSDKDEVTECLFRAFYF